MRKKTPDASKLTRANAAPYTLRKTEPSATNCVVAKDKGDKKVETKVDVKTLAASDGKVDAKFDDVKSGPVNVEPTDGAPKPGGGPKSATHNEGPAEVIEQPRERADTAAMPVVAPVGAPPEMPATAPAPAPPPASAKTVEDPTHMPSAKHVPAGNPTDPALPPGHVPPGDSRSFRRGNDFALVYRQGTCVITRFGTVGQRGQWRVVEYPTSASASNSYAKECSRFVAEGFSDYRD